ncbi:MAG: multiheme c-type cytochrome [Gemmatimonadota bacterium]
MVPTPRLPRAIPCLAAAALLLAGSRASAAPNAPDEAVYQSAAVCAQCHPEIHRTWRGSLHARAFTDPAFQLAYDRVRRAEPGRTTPCEWCHNPMRFLLAPGDPRAAIFAQEGVTCDFCHSVESASAGGDFPRYRARPGVKFGPWDGRSGKSPHTTRFSRLHLSSTFCAGCHELRNAHGVPVLSTYSEWEESFYRGEGVQCQFCHLPQLFGADFIAASGGKGPLDHAMVGGHSRDRLAKAIPLEAALTLSGAEARLTIRVKNDTVGHKTPSGIPSHRIRLASVVYDDAGTALGRKDEVFERVLGDGNGQPLPHPEMVFTEAREVLKDNRIAPKETREVVHVFPVAGSPPAAAEVSLSYEIPTPDVSPELRTIDVPIARVVIPIRRGSFARLVAPIAGAVAAIALLAAAVLLRRRTR